MRKSSLSLLRIKTFRALAFAYLSGACFAQNGPPPVWTHAEGNPMVANGITWRADHIWPDNPMDSSAYHPMVWKGTAWRPESEESSHGNWPRIAIEHGVPLLVTAGNWDDHPGRKIPALIIAPESAATFQLEGRIQAKIFQGDRDVIFLLLKRGDGFVEEITRIEIPNETDVELPSDPIQLAKGEELAIVAVLPTNNAADVHLIDFGVNVK